MSSGVNIFVLKRPYEPSKSKKCRDRRPRLSVRGYKGYSLLAKILPLASESYIQSLPLGESSAVGVLLLRWAV